MANQDGKAVKPGVSKIKIAGIVLFWVGMATIIVSFLIFSSFVEDIREPESITPTSVSFFIAVGGIIFILIGATLFFVGRSQEKKQKALGGHDS